MPDQEWWREAVLYEVYVRSFADSDGDGVGDLRGITARLDHLNDGTPASLGVDAIWLSPFYPSPQHDVGYDISDHIAVDRAYGTLADFDELLAAAHDRGIRILVDLVMNHTSIEHPWFVDARSRRDHPKRSWYIWADPRPDGAPPNNWLSSFEECGSAWSWDEGTEQFYLHSFMPEQPDLNWRNPEVREEMRRIWRFWLDRGVDGFRVDAVHRIMKDIDLLDNPAEIAQARRHLSHPALRQRNLDLPEVHDVLRELRAVLDGYGGRVALGEVPMSDDRRLVDYFGGDGMHTAFHLALWEQPWNGTAFREVVDGLAALMRPGALPTHALSTHDIPRTAYRFGGPRRARVAALLQMTLRGVPCVYYGEEIGMTNVPPPPGRVHDVDGRDPVRSPMQWDATGAGFSSGTPWLPAGPDLAEVNVADQAADPRSLLGLYRRLIWFRKRSAALRRGTYRPLTAGDDHFGYLREAPGERLLVALNFSSGAAWVDLPDDLGCGGRVELSTRPGREGRDVDLRGPLLLAPDEGVVVRLHDEEGS